MRTKLNLGGDDIHLSVSSRYVKSNLHDFAWKLAKKDLRIIALWQRMVGDEDSFFLIFIDKKAKVYPLNLNMLSNGRDLEYFLKTEFNVEILDGFTTARVLFPPELFGARLYGSNCLFDIKRALCFVHPGTGKLSTNITNYLQIHQ